MLKWKNEIMLFNVALNSYDHIGHISFDEMRLIENSRVKSLAKKKKHDTIYEKNQKPTGGKSLAPLDIKWKGP